MQERNYKLQRFDTTREINRFIREMSGNVIQFKIEYIQAFHIDYDVAQEFDKEYIMLYSWVEENRK